MPKQIVVTPPSSEEQVRQLAEALAKMHHILGILVEDAKYFLPGEVVDEIRYAYEESLPMFDSVVQGLLNTKARPRSIWNEEALSVNGLLGATGTAKRDFLDRLADRFLGLWNILPEHQRSNDAAAAAGLQYLEFGATVAGSVPGAEYIEEFMQLVKQLISARTRHTTD